MDKKTPELEKVALIENHILNDNFGTDLNFDQEIRDQLAQSTKLQERLKTMQTQTIYDPIKFIESDYLRRALHKKLLEFTGTTLIQNIKNMY